jgi:ABC-2 type transport system permease protein
VRGVLVELSRFRSRRAVVALVVAMLAISGVVMAAVVYETRPLTVSEQDRAEQRFERERTDALPQIEQCLEDPEQFFGGPVDAAQCETLGPQLEWFAARPTLDLDEAARSTGPGVGVALAALAILVGATFAGADWSSGSMTNQLLFRPRRLRLWLSKAVAVVLGTTAAAAVSLAVFWGCLVAVAQARSLGVGEEIWREILLGSGRGLVLVAAGGLGGYALTMWLRRTGGTIGLMFGFTLVTELMVSVLPFDRVSQWSILNNLAAWAGGGTEVYDDSGCVPTAPCDPLYTLTFTHAAAVLGALLLVALVVSLVTFRRRDID